MNKKTIAIILGILLIASFSIVYSIKKIYSASSEIQILQKQVTDLNNKNIRLQQQIDKILNIPLSVLTKYKELDSQYGKYFDEEQDPQYKKQLGTKIRLCTKNTEKIYAVSGNGLFSGETFYYSENGSGIDSSFWNDVIGPNPPPKPLINIQEYQCTIKKESE